MSSYFFDRRRSELFAELLDDPDHLRRHRRRSRTESEMDWGVRTLRRIGVMSRGLTADSCAPAEFRHAFRGMLVSAARRQTDHARPGAEPTSSTSDTVPRAALIDRSRRAARPGQSHRAPSVLRAPSSGTARTRAAVLIGVTAGALALSGVSAASTDSLPGDPLYQVKRSSEQAQLALAASDQTRGQLYLEFAHSRILEARQVGSPMVAEVLADMDAETVSGVFLLTNTAVQRKDPALLGTITAFIAEQRKRLGELHKTLSSAGAESLRGSTHLLDLVDQRVNALAHALVKGCAIATVDNLGPKPTTC